MNNLIKEIKIKLKLVILAILVAFAASEMHSVKQAMVDQIKAKATTWTPMEPEENPFAYMTIEEIKSMMGTKLLVDVQAVSDEVLMPQIALMPERPSRNTSIRSETNKDMDHTGPSVLLKLSVIDYQLPQRRLFTNFSHQSTKLFVTEETWDVRRLIKQGLELLGLHWYPNWQVCLIQVRRWKN